jgi:hypothetical protein
VWDEIKEKHVDELEEKEKKMGRDYSSRRMCVKVFNEAILAREVERGKK